jgi:hypothetical protein
MMDGDPAGERASVKIGRKTMSTFSTFVAKTPAGSDPKVLARGDFKFLLRHAVKVEEVLDS